LPRGGKRQGKPGATYTNRTDLMRQPVKTSPSPEYGTAVRQAEAQRAVPLAAAPPPPVPGAAGPLDRPSERPSEPITAGMPMGPGPGPEVLGPQFGGPDPVADLRALYLLYPNEDLRRLIEDYG
jgi:hypothetical protein